MSFRKYGGIPFVSKSNLGSLVTPIFNLNNNNAENLLQPLYYPTLSNDSQGHLSVDGNLSVNGNINCSNDIVIYGSITSGSDYRLKENVSDLTLSKYTIDNLRPIYFQYKDSQKKA